MISVLFSSTTTDSYSVCSLSLLSIYLWNQLIILEYRPTTVSLNSSCCVNAILSSTLFNFSGKQTNQVHRSMISDYFFFVLVEGLKPVSQFLQFFLRANFIWRFRFEETPSNIWFPSEHCFTQFNLLYFCHILYVPVPNKEPALYQICFSFILLFINFVLSTFSTIFCSFISIWNIRHFYLSSVLFCQETFWNYILKGWIFREKKN